MSLQTRVSNGRQPPDDSVTHKQKIWDFVVDVEYTRTCSVVIAGSMIGPYCWRRQHVPHSGDLLHTLPFSALVVNLDDNAIRVTVGLRLGCAICQAHCCPCGVMVDPLGQHALSCKKQSGRVQLHAWLNDLIHRDLIRAETPAVKELQVLSRDDRTERDPMA